MTVVSAPEASQNTSTGWSIQRDLTQDTEFTWIFR